MVRVLVGIHGNPSRSSSSSFLAVPGVYARQYLCIVGGVCLLLVFHVHIHRPLPHELRWGSEESTVYLLLYLNSRCREV
jgi:hypothetical protein